MLSNTMDKYLSTTVLLHLCFFLHHLTTPIAGNTSYSYTPQDSITLDCGSSINTTQYPSGRAWTGDINSISIHLEQNKASNTSTASPQNPNVDQVPYLTARLSRFEFTYTFQVTSGPKFIRFYFYPVQYDNFDPSKAFFSVKAGPHTLLKNFSASLTADAYNRDTLIREFIVNVDQDQKLNITFTPSPDNPDAYAFINGIEVVSMPADLYYSRDGFEGFMFIGPGQGISFRIESTTSLETVYRLNVGGKAISPADDTGMFRSWSSDDDYVTDRRPSALTVNIDNVILNFKSISPYAAPLEVYNTARTMGPNGTINENYNLTWEFPVDSHFTYFIRLHFCEFEREVTMEKHRVFQIFVANQTAEHLADVISWTGEKGFPIFKDYAVLMEREESEKKRNLTIALHPHQWTNYFSDAILNGLELFKVSNTYDLSGPNPDPSPATPPPTAPRSPLSKKPNRTKTVVEVIGGVVIGLLALSLVGFLIFRRRMRVKGPGSSDKTSSRDPTYYSTTKSTKTYGISLPSDLCRHFSLAEIKAATNNFDEIFTIGVGGFGNVYKGYIDDGSTPVAIKRLMPGSQQGAYEFMTEIQMLSQLRHLHLVSLIGYCNDDHEMILVYDYMARGTLRDHLYNTDNFSLSWKQRLKICIGAAHGLHYLHTGAKHMIIHRDVKTTNILLDEKWVAKVSDFGLSKIGSTSVSKAHVSTVVKGSLGYLDPEYYRRQQLTEKSDVYSFGVVLFEVLCGRPPLIRTVEKKRMYLADWARECYSNGTLDQIVDSCLKGEIAGVCLKKYGEIAVSSLVDDGTKRPSMREVVWGLEFALQLQESAEENIEMKNEEEVAFFKARSIDDSDVFLTCSDRNMLNWKSSDITVSSSSGGDISHASQDSNKLMVETVLSEIRDPNGR